MSTTTRNHVEPLASPDTRVYSAPTAARLAGISYRQIDHWERTRVMRPSVQTAAGSGSVRRYNSEDVGVLAVLRELSRLGAHIVNLALPTERVRIAIERGDRWLVATPEAVVDSCTDEQLPITVEAAGAMGAWLLDMNAILAGVEDGNSE